MLSYNYCHWSQHTHIRSTWHFSELGPQADTDKNYKCCKWCVAKGSLKPDIFHKNSYCLVCLWSRSTGHCICGTISWYFWLTWKGINTRVRNRSRNVLPSRCSQEICLWILPEGFYTKSKETDLLKALHIFASGTGVHGWYFFFQFADWSHSFSSLTF